MASTKTVAARLVSCLLASTATVGLAQVSPEPSPTDAAAALGTGGATQPQSQAGTDLGAEIIVLATRTSEVASKVPLSVTAYLRERLTVAPDLLHESGSVFVQIGDENVHRLRGAARASRWETIRWRLGRPRTER